MIKRNGYSRPIFFLMVFVFLSYLIFNNYSVGQANNTSQDNMENYENFHYEEVKLNASSIKTEVGIIHYDSDYFLRVGFDSYHFSDDSKNNLIIQMDMGPVLTSEEDQTIKIQLENDSISDFYKANMVKIYYLLNVSLFRDGQEIFNNTYVMGVKPTLEYNKLVMVIENESKWAESKYSIIYRPWIMVNVQLSETEFHYENRFTISQTVGNFSAIHVRSVIREVNPILEIYSKIMNFEYFDGIFFGIIIFIAIFFRTSLQNPANLSPIQSEITPTRTNNEGFIQIGFISDINPIDDLQQTIKPYFLFMLLPIPFVFIAQFVPILGAIGFIFFLNYFPLIGMIRYQIKFGKLIPFKQFMKWHLITDIFMIFGLMVAILFVALNVLGYILDSAQILLYLLTFIYVFNFVHERRREFELNKGIKKYVILPILIGISIVLLIRYIVPLFLFIVMQSYPPGDYIPYYQYQIAALVVGLEKIRWEFNVGGILFIVYILNQYQLDLMKIYDPRNTKKFIAKFCLIFYAVLFMIATMIVPHLSNIMMFQNYIDPYLVMMQKELIPYNSIQYLYPDALARSIISFASTNPNPFSFGTINQVNLTNIFILIGITLSIPKLYFYIFTNPLNVDLFSFEYLFRQKFKHFTLMTTGIIGFCGYMLLASAVEAGFIVIITYCGYILWQCYQVSNNLTIGQNITHGSIQTSERYYCTHCGFRNKPGAHFCSQCGQKI